MTELLNGLLTIVFETHTTKTLPQKIIAKNKYIENFLDKTMYIETDYNKSQRIFNGIEKSICHQAFYFVLLCREQIIE